MEFVKTRTEREVGYLIFNRPEKLNALYGKMREEVLEALEGFNGDRSTRVIVITGEGRGFCAGGDIRYLEELKEKKDHENFRDLLEYGRKVIRAIIESEKPVIASVNGPAAGAGLNIALACDIRLASDRATFGETFVRLGLHPDWGGSWLLPRIVGIARACEMVFTGSMIDAREAERIGLVNRVVPHGDLEKVTRQMAEAIAALPPLPIRLAKKSLYQGLQWDLPATLAKELEHQMVCFQSKDSMEGITAFLERRSPQFCGE